LTANDSGLSPDYVPDIKVNVREVFDIDQDLDVPAFSERSDYVPAVDEDYRFDHDTTLAILAGFAHNRRVMIQGYHGTGKSTHIEQVAARLLAVHQNQSGQPYQPHRPGGQGRYRHRGRSAGDRVP
jgi:cobaltochelatase CobS